MRVIVTRPAAQATSWAAELGARGIDAAALPLLSIGPPADIAAVRQAWCTLPTRRLAVFVSPNAVEQFFALRPVGADWPAGLLAASPGPGTSRALHDASVPVQRIIEPSADAPQLDSEALWQQLQRHDWRSAEVLVVRGDGGREWLADTLAAHGAVVSFVAAYQRRAPTFTAAEHELLAQALARPEAHCWLFSSSEAVDHLTARLRGVGEAAEGAPALAAALAASSAIASHPRIAQRAAAAGFGHVSSCRPAIDAVVACIQSRAS